MRYRMKQSLISFGDDFYIEDDRGARRYFVDGAAISIGNKLSFQDMDGNERLLIREKLIAVRKTYQIYRCGSLVATVKKALISPLGARFTIDVEGGSELEATGDILGYEYSVSRGRSPVAQISKKILAIRDSYVIDIVEEDDIELILAVAVAVDLLAHGKRPSEEDD